MHDNAATEAVPKRNKGGRPVGTTAENSLREARRRKEWALAKLREEELAQKREELVSAQEARDYEYKRVRAFRDALLNWPLKVAAELAAECQIADPAAFHFALERKVVEFLAGCKELRIDGNGCGDT